VEAKRISLHDRLCGPRPSLSAVAAVVVCAAVVVEAAVCGSDGRSYAGQCAVTVAACMSGRSLDVLHDGPCDELSGSGANDEHSTGRLQPTAATISSAAVSS